MKTVKANKMKRGMVAVGHDRRDFPKPATVLSVEPSPNPDCRGWYRITFSIAGGIDWDDFPPGAGFKVTR